MNTTDNQVTAQVKAEPTVAKPATRTVATEGEHKQTRRRTNTAALLAKGRTRQQTAGEGEATRQRRHKYSYKCKWWSY